MNRIQNSNIPSLKPTTDYVDFLSAEKFSIIQIAAWLTGKANLASCFSHSGVTGSICGQPGLIADRLLGIFTAVWLLLAHLESKGILLNVSVAKIITNRGQ